MVAMSDEDDAVGYRLQLPESCDFPVPKFSGDRVSTGARGLVTMSVAGDHGGAPAPKIKYLAMVLNDLETEKAALISQLEAEDRDRHSYFAKLEAISKEIRELPVPTDSPSLECELERRRLEQEAHRLQDAMLKTMGPAGEGLKRRESRLLTLRNIDQKIFAVSSLLAERQREEEGEGAAPRESREYLHDIQDEEGVPDAIAAHPQYAPYEEKAPFPLLQDQSWLQVNALWASMSSNNVTIEDRGQIHDTASLVSFTSSIHSMGASRGINTSSGGTSSGGIGTKVEVVYNLLSLLASHDRENISKTLLVMSETPDTCLALRQAGVLPLLVQLLHGADLIPPGTNISSPQSPPDSEARRRASQALRNIVLNQADDKRSRKEARILKLLETVRNYSDFLRDKMEEKRLAFRDDMKGLLDDDEMQNHPGGAVASLLKFSFEEEHRSAIAHLGGLHALAELIQVDTDAHGIHNDNQYCQTMRRYIAMTLTNLTFGDSLNKSLLCAIKGFLLYMARVLISPCEELRQVFASVLRNLSWRADTRSKEFLKESGIVRSLTLAAMDATKETTLKAVLSALWNLSGHCSENKIEICQIEGSVAFLVDTLLSNVISVVENGGGILRNISNHIAMKEELREILRRNNCIPLLLQQLRSPSLTVVSNACGTLWNLSARSAEDQKKMFDLGAVPLLRALVHSRHKMIALGASAALKNLLTSKPHGGQTVLDVRSRGSTPSLQARKQRAFEQEIDPNIDEICENIETPSPLEERPQDPFDRTVMQALAYRSLGQRYRSISPNILGRQLSHDEMVTSIRSDSQIDKGYRHSTVYMNRDLASAGSCRSSSLDRQLNREHYERSSGRYVHPKVAWKSCDENLRAYPGSTRQRAGPPSFSVYDDNPDQPIDYSVKYAEMTAVKPVPVKVASSRDPATAKKVLVYGAYSETNIEEAEQPTNFGARYGERDDGEVKGKEARPDFSEDAVQTFCTEGTPYETPGNFSHATSVSDLRDPSFLKIPDKDAPESQEVSGRASRLEDDFVENDKPKTYLTEDTPGLMSRISSENSIDMGHESEKAEEHKEAVNEESPGKESVRMDKGKAVTFGIQEEFYAEQTPLMFSRASSIESLDSVRTPGLQQQQEDGCSVVSEFSRLVSRAVSPSELPDSPCQTMPPSPRTSRRDASDARGLAPMKPLRNTPPPQQPKESVFRDSVQTFEQEGTPAFTRDGSPLSCLSIADDKPAVFDPPPNPRRSVPQDDFGDDEIKNYGVEGTPGLTRATSLSSLCRDEEEISPPALKAATRLPASLPPENLEKIARNTLTMQDELDAVNALYIPRQNPVVPRQQPNHYFEDLVRSYREEGTPGYTRATSLSSLSFDGSSKHRSDHQEKSTTQTVDLSPEPTSSGASWDTVVSGTDKVEAATAATLQITNKPVQNFEESEGSGSDDDNILAMCISSGMQAAIKKKPVVVKKVIPRSTSMPLKPAPPSKDVTPKKAASDKWDGPVGVPKSHSSNAVANRIPVDSVSDSDSDGDDQILAQCIQSAILKARPSVRPLSSSKDSKKEAPNTRLHHVFPVKSQGHLSSTKTETKASPAAHTNQQLVQPAANGQYRDSRRSRSSSGRMDEPQAVNIVPRTTHTPQLLARLAQPVPQATVPPPQRNARSRHFSQPDKRPEDQAAPFVLENTPLSFSRNSSLSSLSFDSDDAVDEELLKSCISRGMPKAKPDTKAKPQLKMNAKYQTAPIDGLERKQGDGKENSKGNSPKFGRPDDKPADKIKASQVKSPLKVEGEDEKAGSPAEELVLSVERLEDMQRIRKPQFEVGPVICEPMSVDYDSGVGKSCKESIPIDEKDQDTTESLSTVMPSEQASLNIEENLVSVNAFGNEGLVFPDNMTESTMLREAHTLIDELNRDPLRSSNHELALDGVSSLTASMMVDDWPDGKEELKRQASLNRHFDSRTYKVNKSNNLLKQAIGTYIEIDAAKLSVKCASQDSLSASCHSNIDSIKPPSNLTDPDVMGMSFVNSTSGSISSGMFASKNGNLSMKSSFNADMVFEPDRQDALLEELARMEREIAEKSQQSSPELAVLTISGLTAQIQNLTVDGGSESASSSDAGGKGGPKERRKSDRDRYNTYTLKQEDLRLASVDIESSAEGPQGEEKRKSPKEKRAENKERFRTRTISASDLRAEVPAEQPSSPEQRLDVPELENEVFKVTQDELETIKKDANMIIKRLGGNEVSEELLDFETLSLVSNDSISNIGSRKASKAETYRCDDTGESEPELDEEDPRGPRVTKPGEGPSGNDPPGIRGRKRVAMTHRMAVLQQNRPHSNPNAQAKPLAKSSPLGCRRGRSASPASSVQSDHTSQRGPSPLASVRTNRTITLRQANSLNKLQMPKLTESPMRKQGSNRSVQSNSPKQSEEKTTPNKAASQRSLGPVGSGSKSSLASENTPTKNTTEPPKLKKEGTFTKETTAEPQASGNEKKRVPPKVLPKPKLVQPVSRDGKDKAPVKKLKAPFEGESSSPDSSKKITPPKKHVSSKIANLWRQVEESRGKQKKEESDTRKWIGKDKQEEEPRERTLVSSTTFDKLPTASLEPAPQEEKKSLGVRLTLKFPRFGKSKKQVPEPSPSSSDTKSPETPQLVEACFSDESPADMEKPRDNVMFSRLGSFVFVPGQHVDGRTETTTDVSPTSDDSHNGNKRPKKIDNKTGSVLVTTV